MESITVHLGQRSYPVMIGSGVVSRLGPLLEKMNHLNHSERRQGDSSFERGMTARRVAVVTDSNVAPHYRDPLLQSLTRAGYDPWVIVLPPGEQQKDLATLSLVYDKLIEGRIERRSPLIALGGGVVGDLTGFAAATFQRGVPFIQVPTTLLAQIDSSVGGKTAVNHPAGKNLIGAFYQPCLVLIDVDTLKTLPQREFVAGVAEVIKYGVILSPDLFALLEEQLDRLLGLDPVLLTSIIKTCCQLKAQVVEADEQEADYRAILNFGHTLGHAVESATGYERFLHGEAVAIGMAFAAKLSLQRGLCRAATRDRLVGLLQRAGLPVDIPPDIVEEHLRTGIGADKKVSAGKVKFVCLEQFGKTRFEVLSAAEIVRSISQGEQ